MVEKIKHEFGEYQPEHKKTAKWWYEKEPHSHVFSIVKRIKEDQDYRQRRNLDFARLYGNANLIGLKPGSHMRTFNDISANKLTLNVSKSCVDTAASKIGTNKPRPIFLTVDGRWKERKRGEKLTEYFEGWFAEQKIYDLGRRVFIDACVFGLGALKLYKHNGVVKAERVICDEIYVDDAEGMYGKPRQLHQLKYYNKDVLKAMFPDKSDLIDSARQTLDPHASMHNADLIEVVESWHLPSGKDADDGKHSITIQNGTLFTKEYKRMRFPFAFFRWSNRLVGFHGMGLIEELIGIQLEVNKMIRNIQDAHQLMSNPQIWLEASNRGTARITNKKGAINYYTGNAPLYVTPNAMSSEYYQHLERLYQKAYEVTGISVMSAQAKKPSGVTAAVAMRELKDSESERFQTVVNDYEEFYMDVTDLAFDLHEELVSEGEKPTTNYRSKSAAKKIDWSAARMDRKEFVLRKYPTGLLPSEPIGKVQKVQEMVEAGWIGRDDAMTMLDFPDTQKLKSLQTSAKELNQKILDSMLDTGNYITPEPYLNLEMARMQASQTYLKAQLDDAPEDRLQLLRDFINDIDTIIETQQQAQMQGQMQAQQGMQAEQAQDQMAEESVEMQAPQMTNTLI